MTLPYQSYDRVVCIPTFEECEFLPSVIQDLQRSPYRILLIINNNCQINAVEKVIIDNQKLHTLLMQNPHNSSLNHHLIEMGNVSIHLIDHSHDQ